MPYANTPSASDGDNRSAKELMDECRRRCLDIAGCVEREDLLRLLKNADRKKYAHAAQPVPQPSLPVREPPTSCGKPAASVWDRSGTPPAHLLSKRSQALWLLGLDVGPGQRATQSELRHAYRRAAMESHPDKLQNHDR